MYICICIVNVGKSTVAGNTLFHFQSTRTRWMSRLGLRHTLDTTWVMEREYNPMSIWPRLWPSLEPLH